MRALPDLPVKAAADLAAREEVRLPAKIPVVARAEPQAGGRMVQVGSFGSQAAAETAWKSLQSSHPTANRYAAAFQKVTTSAGKPVVRLKVGPVTSDGQARQLCDSLGVADAWCSKS